MSTPPSPSPSPSPSPPPLPAPFTISDLQIDFVVAEILPRLPAKTLLRFKTVSKYFNTLISSPSFVLLHLRHSLSSHHRLLAVPSTSRSLLSFHLSSLSPVSAPVSPVSAAVSAPVSAPVSPVSAAVSAVSAAVSAAVSSMSLTVSAAVSVPVSAVSGAGGGAAFYWPTDSYGVAVVGACNGLLLVSDGDRRLIILNPSTRTYVDVLSGTTRNLGFGFDHRSDDYKIVIVSDTHTDLIRTRTTKIYSVNSKSCNVVDTSFPSDSLEERYGGVLIGNHLLHWRFWSPSKKKRRIGCFDICLEKWMDDVLLPSYYYDPGHRNYLLDFGVVDGRMFSSFENRDDLTYDVWVMKEYGVEESWTLLLSVPISDGLKGGVVPVACQVGGSSSQVLIKQRHASRLFMYNKVDGVISKVNVPYRSGLQPYVFTGSLVSLPGAKFFGDVYEPPVEPPVEEWWV